MGPIDGTIVPSAAAGSLPFLPDQCLKVLRGIRDNYEDRCWKRYGFVDAFNPHDSWTNADVVGINIGITTLMAANLNGQMPWKIFMKARKSSRYEEGRLYGVRSCFRVAALIYLVKPLSGILIS